MRRKLQDNLRNVRRRIADACARVGRDPTEVQLVAVTKAAGVDVIRTLYEMGLCDYGENRAQQLAQRGAMMAEWISRRHAAQPNDPPIRWHMIGQLQRNKVKAVLPWVCMIQSVDRLRLAEEINKRAADAGVVADVLMEVNGSNEPQKSGVAVCAAPHLGEQIASMPNLRLRGLMTMAPWTDDKSAVARVFERIKELMDEIHHEYNVGAFFDTYSAGMSSDFEQAVEHGSTMVRIGGALLEGVVADHETRSEPLPSNP